MKQSECLSKATAVSATKDAVKNHIRIRIPKQKIIKSVRCAFIQIVFTPLPVVIN